MAYNINYNDKRFTQVTSEKNAAIKESNSTYDQMINSSDKYYQGQINAVKDYGETQKQNQQAQTDFAIEKIEQQKDQAHKDYLKEQSGAYVDWQKQSDQYGSNAEQQAKSGLAQSGYSESSQVSMYNTYQNRVMTARESYIKAVQNYDNAITEARLQNNSLLAEIAYETLQKSLELSLQGFQYKNQLVLEKANAKRELDNTYYSRYQNVLSQINTENALAEQVRQYNANLAEEKRQYNASLALQKEQLAEQKRQYNLSYELQKKNSSVSSSGSGGGGTNLKKDDRTTATRDDGSGSTSNTKKNTSNEPTVDMKSVTALGYGPISASKLNSLVTSGEVIEYESNGKLKYKRAAKSIKNDAYLVNKYKKLYGQQ